MPDDSSYGWQALEHTQRHQWKPSRYLDRENQSIDARQDQRRTPHAGFAVRDDVLARAKIGWGLAPTKGHSESLEAPVTSNGTAGASEASHRKVHQPEVEENRDSACSPSTAVHHGRMYDSSAHDLAAASSDPYVRNDASTSRKSAQNHYSGLITAVGHSSAPSLSELDTPIIGSYVSAGIISMYDDSASPPNDQSSLPPRPDELNVLQLRASRRRGEACDGNQIGYTIPSSPRGPRQPSMRDTLRQSQPSAESISASDRRQSTHLGGLGIPPSSSTPSTHVLSSFTHLSEPSTSHGPRMDPPTDSRHAYLGSRSQNPFVSRSETAASISSQLSDGQRSLLLPPSSRFLQSQSCGTAQASDLALEILWHQPPAVPAEINGTHAQPSQYKAFCRVEQSGRTEQLQSGSALPILPEKPIFHQYHLSAPHSLSDPVLRVPSLHHPVRENVTLPARQMSHSGNLYAVHARSTLPSDRLEPLQSDIQQHGQTAQPLPPAQVPRRTTSRGQPSNGAYLPTPPTSPTISLSFSLPDSHAGSASWATSISSRSRSGTLKQHAADVSSNLSVDGVGVSALQSRRSNPILDGGSCAAFVSAVAVALRETIERSINMKDLISYPQSFTGESIVSAIADLLHYPYTGNRRIALNIARTMYAQLFFVEVEWDSVYFADTAKQLFRFEMESIDHSTPSSMLHDGHTPSGIVTRLTACYSPSCGLEGTDSLGVCYSPSCPNALVPPPLQRKPSAMSVAPNAEEAPMPEDWASTVSTILLEQLGSKEARRQGILFEFIRGEQEYKKDLDTFETAFRDALRTAIPPVINDGPRLNAFMTDVFANLDEVRQHCGRFVDNLLARQREQSPVVHNIGDIILDACLAWGRAFIDYAESQVKGEYLVQEERKHNMAFAAFLKSRRDRMGIKQDFRHFHLRAPIRLQRYLLLLGEYIEKTDDSNLDIETVKTAIGIIRDQCAACNAAVEAAQLKLACVRYHELIQHDSNYSALDLLHPARQLHHHGRMLARPEGSLAEWMEYEVMLFDHFLTIAKSRRTGDGLRLIRKPIRLEMLSLGGFDDPPQTRSSGFHIGRVINSGDRRDALSSTHGATSETRVWPISLRISGRDGGTYTLFVETSKLEKDDRARQEWRSKLEQAIAIRQAELDANSVFTPNVLMDPDIRRAGTTASIGQNVKVICSCPFYGPDDQPLVAFGTSLGLYIAVRHDPATLRQVLQIPVSYCAVLRDFGIFMIQSDGRLYAYLVDSLIMSSSPDPKSQAPPQQVSGQKDVIFFRVGKVGPRTLAVYAKRDGVNSTVLKAMEPITATERARAQHSRFLGMGGKKTDWFRQYKDAIVPTDVYDLSFTRSKLALDCTLGFEILDIETLKTASFPDWAALKLNAQRYDARLATLQRRCQEAKALSLFRVSDRQFLFCYDTFAIFADKHGDPLPDRYGDIIEWEGRPTAIVYHKPYVLAFENRFVEIRDIHEPTKIVQIIRGVGIRCSYEGQGMPSDSDVRSAMAHHLEDLRPHMVVKEGGVDRVYELRARTS